MNMDVLKPQGKIVIIVAPSGAGKSTLIAKLKADYPTFVESISYTTRPKREGDIHGVQYFFVTKEEFLKLRDQEEFLEWAQVHGNFYGTSKKFVIEKIKAGANVLFDLDVQGANSFKKFFGDQAHVIFICPPSLEELEKRLRKRGTDSDEVIAVRLKNAKREIERKDDYDFCVLNDDLDRAYKQLKGIVKSILEE